MFPAYLLVDTVTVSRPVVTGEGQTVEVLAMSAAARVTWRTVRQAAGNAITDTRVATVYLHRSAPTVQAGDLLTLPDGKVVEVKSAEQATVSGRREGLGVLFQKVEAS